MVEMIQRGYDPNVLVIAMFKFKFSREFLYNSSSVTGSIEISNSWNGEVYIFDEIAGWSMTTCGWRTFTLGSSSNDSQLILLKNMPL